MYTQCQTPDKDNELLFLRVNDTWLPYRGNTSLRKIYYRAYEALTHGGQSFYVFDYESEKVTGAIFPPHFSKYLRCSSIDGIHVSQLPSRILLQKRNCKWTRLENGLGKVCTYCGYKEDF